MLRKKLVTAQKRGETRALCLGLAMVVCSGMMYFFIGVTIVPSYSKSVWTKEAVCRLIKASIKEKVHCSFNEGSGDENNFYYPCLEVYVNLTVLGQMVMLYNTEETVARNPKCFYIPPNMGSYNEVQKHVDTTMDYIKKKQTFTCYYDPSRTEASVISERLYDPRGLVITSLWPTLMLLGGLFIVILVKTSQCLSALAASQYKISI
uniref:Potassium calcium-activated channel subfamily M regulatory beta subunit 1 n=1 Tax=Salvator merianae TaxID=96440 RepID=A0A8D0B0S2_SALMN